MTILSAFLESFLFYLLQTLLLYRRLLSPTLIHCLCLIFYFYLNLNFKWWYSFGSPRLIRQPYLRPNSGRKERLFVIVCSCIRNKKRFVFLNYVYLGVVLSKLSLDYTMYTWENVLSTQTETNKKAVKFVMTSNKIDYFGSFKLFYLLPNFFRQMGPQQRHLSNLVG